MNKRINCFEVFGGCMGSSIPATIHFENGNFELKCNKKPCSRGKTECCLLCSDKKCISAQRPIPFIVIIAKIAKYINESNK